jgi:hypothetical protein
MAALSLDQIKQYAALLRDKILQEEAEAAKLLLDNDGRADMEVQHAVNQLRRSTNYVPPRKRTRTPSRISFGTSMLCRIDTL